MNNPCFRCGADVDYGISMTVETGLVDAQLPSSSEQFLMCVDCGTRMQLIVEAPLIASDRFFDDPVHEMLCECFRCDRSMYDQYMIASVRFDYLGAEEERHRHFYMCAWCAHEISRIVYTPSSRRGHQV